MIVFDAPNEAEKDDFRFDSFPRTSGGISEFIFSKTGFSNTTKPLGLRGWHLLNRSLNEGMKLDLDEPTLRTLSLMDDALSHVQRFAGMPHMHEIAADSTAAHSHQVMRVIDEVTRKAFPNHMPPAINSFRKEAILGAWVHDMGEIVTELATATDMFNMNAHERAPLGKAKDAFEHEMFKFSCDLASHCLEQRHPEMFAQEIAKLRQSIEGKNDMLDRVKILRDGITNRREQLGLTQSEVGKHLLEIYERTESPSQNNMLHPFVKTLECVEGQRYLQRNAKYQPHTHMALATSHEVVEGVRRCERRLPLLMQEAEKMTADGNECAAFYKLAQHAAHFTYGSIARQFAPDSNETYVSVAPPYIHRKPDPRSEPFSDEIKPESRHLVRARQHSLLEDQHATQAKNMLDVPIWTREQTGAVYRTAQAVIMQAHPRFKPQTASLLSFENTPKLPDEIAFQLDRDKLVSTPSPSQGRAA